MAKKVVNLTHPEAVTFNIATATPENPDGVRPVYSNNAGLFVGPQEVRIIFSEIFVSSVTLGTTPSYELRANVSMAFIQFKAFADAVAQTLTNVEKKISVSAWPPKSE
jgi:hypothetical protein